MFPIRKAVFPVAGLGTRFLPATKAMPKEMLPVVDKPLIQYAVEEAVAAGITELVFVTGRNKRAIEDHFDRVPELELELESKNKVALLDSVRSVIPDHVKCVYTRQPAAHVLRLSGIVEKPDPADAPSDMAVVGRYVLDPSIFQALHNTQPGVGGEIQLTDAIASLMAARPVFGYEYDGTRYDCGSKEGFYQATMEIGRKYHGLA
jgi:UTP-glucose-1-phosphate uridylyltransferase